MLYFQHEILSRNIDSCTLICVLALHVFFNGNTVVNNTAKLCCNIGTRMFCCIYFKYLLGQLSQVMCIFWLQSKLIQRISTILKLNFLWSFIKFENCWCHTHSCTLLMSLNYKITEEISSCFRFDMQPFKWPQRCISSTNVDSCTLMYVLASHMFFNGNAVVNNTAKLCCNIQGGAKVITWCFFTVISF